MRVIAGKARSVPLKCLEGRMTRPTTDRIKETLFNMLSPELAGCSFLDLFSGSGAIGIEALSRGAAGAVFVEKNRRAVSVIEENLRKTGLSGQARILPEDFVKAIARLEQEHQRFDVIFMDPPYDRMLEKAVFERLRESSLADSRTLLVAEASLDTSFSYLEDLGYELQKIKKYKTNMHVFVRKAQEPI